MKRHYEIMRAMRTKVLDSRELWYSVDTILYVIDASQYRANDLKSTSPSFSLSCLTPPRRSIHTDIFTQQNHNPEKHFQNFAYGIVSRRFFSSEMFYF
jgi:hypothetical protein